VFTKNCVSASLTAWSARIGAVAAVSVMTFASSQAQDLRVSGCVAGWGSINCVTRWSPAGDPYVRQVPQPANKAEQARAVQRDRRWLAHCRPVVMPDRYGVGRYHYAAPGCEFGVGAY
jgi:hypothetical protein